MPPAKQNKGPDPGAGQVQAAAKRPPRTDVWIALVLALVTLVAFGPAFRAEFIGLDDRAYVLLNPCVIRGLTFSDVSWACTTFYQSNWHPLTWLSLQLDATLWKSDNGELNPLGFHLTNVFLHAANAVLAFLALRTLTGDRWRSAAAAALFALHPLRVESVAWVTERKDVLSLFFGLGALLAYARYVRSHSPRTYAVAVALLALSLLSKPMMITLPCLLLVLDWWPLGRAKSTADWRRLAVEKAPLFALCLASSIVTFYAQQSGGSVQGLQRLPIGARLANAVVAYATYLGMTAWPIALAPFYPYRPTGWPLLRLVSSGVVVGALTALALWQRRKRPYLLTGWLWYIGTLVPVIGLIQVGDQAFADRYTYFPSLGLCVAVVWLAAEIATARRVAWSPALAAGLVVVLGVLTWRQATFWHDDLRLWPHTIDVTGPNMVAYNNYGATLEKKDGNPNRAMAYFQKAVDIHPGYGTAQFNLARALRTKGRVSEAAEHFQLAIDADPRLVDAYNDLAAIRINEGAHEQAERLFREALQIDPYSLLVRGNLAWLLDMGGRYEEALTEYVKILRANPDDVAVNVRLGSLLGKQGQLELAVQHLRHAVALKPDSTGAQLNCGVALDKLGRTKEALSYFRHAVDLDAKDMRSRLRLATALARLGDTSTAALNYTEASRVDPEWPRLMLQQAWLRATCADPRERDGAEAIWAAECVYYAYQPPSPGCLDTLAAAYAEAGRFGEATAKAEKAKAAAEATQKPELAAAIAGRLALYRDGRPFRQASAGPRP
jgi:tetratricopeptide (TPR) repeat protein